MQLELALVISIASFLGVIIGPVIANLITAHQVNSDRKESRRKEQREYLIRTLHSLVELRAELQFLQGADNLETIRQREVAYGRAYALMLSIPDPGIRVRAENVMTGQLLHNKNEKIDAINDAIKQLGTLVDSVMRENL